MFRALRLTSGHYSRPKGGAGYVQGIPVVMTNPPGLTLGLGLGMGIAREYARKYHVNMHGNIVQSVHTRQLAIFHVRPGWSDINKISTGSNTANGITTKGL